MILVIADRDGTLNHNNRSKLDGPYYTLSPEQFEWMDNAREAVVELQKDGIIVHVVTSQNSISEGLVTLEEVNKIHDKMLQEIVDAGGIQVGVSIVYGVKESDQAKAEAKADAIEAAKELYGNITSVWSVGDTEGDILAGKLVGARTIHVELEHTSEKDKYVAIADYHVKSFKNAADIIRENNNA